MKKLFSFIKAHPNPFMALIYFCIIWPLYFYINQLELHRHFTKHILQIKLDTLIPFDPIWVFAYESLFVIVIFPFVYIKDKILYRRMFFSFCLTGIIAYIVFLVFPTYDILRPVTSPLDFEWYFLTIDNKHDSPYNCFPSLHVGFAMTSGFWTYYADRTKFGLLVLIWAITVSVSVLFVKEHYIADLLGGAILSGALFLLFSRNLQSKIPEIKSERLNNRLWLLIPAGLYTVEVTYFSIKYWDRFKEIF